jgi:hypothetical protein
MGSDAGIVPVLKYLSVMFFTGGDIMRLQGKLLQSRPGEAAAVASRGSCCSRVPAKPGQLLQHVQAGTSGGQISQVGSK